MNRFVRLLVAVGVLTLAACAGTPQGPIALSSASLGEQKIGVGMTALPKVNTHFPGAGCLLCIAAAEAMHTSLTTHTQALPYEDLPQLKDQAAAALKTQGATAKVIAEPLAISKLPSAKTKAPNVAPKDHSGLGATYGVDKLLVIDINALGVVRTFANYFPTSEPKATVSGTVYMLDVKSNTYEWYAPLNVQIGANGTWDEPPAFPGLTNAYYQAIETTKDLVLKPIDAAAPQAAQAAP